MDLESDEMKVALGYITPAVRNLCSSPPIRNVGSPTIIKKGPPNYFIGIRLHGMQAPVESLNQQLVSAQPELQFYLTSTKRLHFTGFVMNLPDEFAVSRAADLLGECEKEIQDIFCNGAPHIVSFRQITDFPGSVLYLEPDQDASMGRLSELTSLLKTRFSGAGLYENREGREDWVPHLTIAKKSKNFKRPVKHKGTLRASSYDAVSQHFFSTNGPALSSALTVVELLSMAGTSTEDSDVLGVDGYYRCIKSVWLCEGESIEKATAISNK